MDCSVFVFTKDPDFKRQTAAALPRLFRRELISFPVAMSDVQSKLSRARPSLILYDLDAAVPLEGLFAQLTAMYKLAVVYTGKGQPPANLNKSRAAFIPKAQLDASETSFLNTLNIKVSSFLLSGAPGGVKDAQSIAEKGAKVIVIASSTGGTEALQKILMKLKPDAPPIMVVQHMPSGFTKLFADRLNGMCNVAVKEAKNNDYLRAGETLIAPAGLHMTVRLSGGRLMAACFEGQRLNGVIPAADILFDSVADVLRQNAVGVILTGMGADGARGLMKMRLNGAKTVGQDKATCVVYGMPKAAFDLGAIDFQLPLDSIADKMIALAQ